MRKNSVKNTRINGEVRRELSRIISRDIKDPRVSGMTSVTDVFVSPDLKTCKVYISVFGDEKSREDTLNGLRNAEGYIRRALAHTVNLRNTPELNFIMDQSIEYGVNMSKHIDKVIEADEKAERQAQENAKKLKREECHKILDCLDQAQTIVISGHTRPDGDCVGSCLAMYHYIKDNYPEKDAQVRLEEVPESYRIIPGAKDVICEPADDETVDLFISLDCSDAQRLASNQACFESAEYRINIDHHASDKGFADENIIFPGASSTCEVLCDVFDHEKISEETAYALYAGIICDSGVFKYSCTGSHTMELAGMLMDKGIPYTDIVDKVFYEKTYIQNKTMGWCLMNSKLSPDGKIISCLISREQMAELGASHSDLEGIVSQMKLTKGTAISLLATESRKGIFKCSLRSDERVDVCKIAQTFGGGGHVRASGFSYTGDIAAALHRAQQLAKEQLDTCTME